MSWYFVSAGAQAGPVSDIQLDEYILAGKVLPDTLVWREGMENWLPCREAKPTAPFKFFSSASKASPSLRARLAALAKSCVPNAARCNPKITPSNMAKTGFAPGANRSVFRSSRKGFSRKRAQRQWTTPASGAASSPSSLTC